MSYSMQRVQGPVTLHQGKWILNVDPNFTRKDQMLFGLLFSASGLFGVFLWIRGLRNPLEVTLREEGFDMITASAHLGFTWKEVRNFRPGWDGVVFDFVEPVRPQRKSREFDVRLVDNFGLSGSALSELMEGWRARALT